MRHAGSDTVYMIHLDQLGPNLEGQPLQVVDFPAGQSMFGPRDTPAASIVRAPGENAVLVAHPIDRAIYFYKEGMAAPMGQFENYRRRARAVLAVDRSLREVESRGTYETAARLAGPGTYDVVFFMNAPRIIHCFSVEVADNPEFERERSPAVAVEWQIAAADARAGTAVELAVELRDREGQPIAGLDDLVFTIHLATPEARRFVVEAKAAGEGRYEAEFVPPKPGPYAISMKTRSGVLEIDPRVAYDLRVGAAP